MVKGEAVVTGLDGRPIGKRKIENSHPVRTAKRVLPGRQAEAGFLA